MASCWRAFGGGQRSGAGGGGAGSSGRPMTALAYRVRRAAGADELAAALELRHEVFCVEQGVPEREERDGRDHQGLHLVAFGDGELLGTCRLVFVGSTVQLS